MKLSPFSPRRCVALIGAVLCLVLAGQALSIHNAWAAVPANDKSEWSTYLRQNPALSTADKELNQIYRRLMKALPPADKKNLLAEQRAWVTRRDTAAIAARPKGSPEYVASLATITAARCAELRERQERSSEKNAAPAPRPHAVEKQTAPLAATPAVPPPAVPTVPATVPASASAVAPEKPVAPTPPAVPSLKASAPAPQPSAPASIASPRAQNMEKTVVQQRQAVPLHQKAVQATPPRLEIPPAREKAKAPRDQAAELNIALPKQKAPTSPSSQVQIDITPARFSRAYNTLAHTLKAAPFPLVPTNVSGNNANRTEHYQIQDGISIQFKYTQSLFDKPEVVTFIGRQFMTGPSEYRDSIAGSLVTLLKIMSEAARPEGKSSDEEIFGFMRTITQAFTADASRVWKNNGFVYVITYMKKTDLFAMTVSLDNRRRYEIH